MHKLYAGQFADLYRALGQGLKPFQVFGSELVRESTAPPVRRWD